MQKTAKETSITPKKEYKQYILKVLSEMGGSAKSRDVIEKVFLKMKNQLTPIDFQKTPSGIELRWKKQLNWGRFELIQQGYLKSDSPFGIWEISEKGRNSIKE